MHTIITIVWADYRLMSQLLLNILSNVTLPPYPSYFVHFKHTFVTHPAKISRFSIPVMPPPRDTACHSPKILNVHLFSDEHPCQRNACAPPPPWAQFTVRYFDVHYAMSHPLLRVIYWLNQIRL